MNWMGFALLATGTMDLNERIRIIHILVSTVTVTSNKPWAQNAPKQLRLNCNPTDLRLGAGWQLR